MTPPDRWLLRTENTTYAVRIAGEGRWAELTAWGPHGVETGESPFEHPHRTHFLTRADAAPAEYLPYGLRPFTGAELVVRRAGQDRGTWWAFDSATADGDRALRLDFTDEQQGLRAALCYETVPGTDVILRWTELSCTGEDELRLERLDSAAVNVPVTGGARLTFLTGQWSQEFTRTQLELTRGRFEMASTQGAPAMPTCPGSPSRTPRSRTGPTPRRTASRWSGPATGT